MRDPTSINFVSLMPLLPALRSLEYPHTNSLSRNLQQYPKSIAITISNFITFIWSDQDYKILVRVCEGLRRLNHTNPSRLAPQFSCRGRLPKLQL